MSGIKDRLNWNLAIRRTVFARKFPDGFTYIPPLLINANSQLMMIGFRNTKAKASWWLAASIYQKLNASPSSISQFQTFTDGFRERCRLNTLTLIKFPDYGVLPFTIEISFPKWHEQMLVEAWWYNGDETDPALETLSEIQSQLTEINFKIDGL